MREEAVHGGQAPGMNGEPGRRSLEGRFAAGRSGNPAGRPRGARNRLTLRLEALLEDGADEIASKAVELAKDGDPRLLKACLDRLLPAGRGRAVAFELPEIECVADLPSATGALLVAVAEGELSPLEASELAKLVDAHVRAITLTDIDDRLVKLEKRMEEEQR